MGYWIRNIEIWLVLSHKLREVAYSTALIGLIFGFVTILSIF